MRRLAWMVVVLGCRTGGSVDDSVTAAPVPADDAITTTEDQAVDVPVLDNDVDPEDDALVVSEIDDETTLGTVEITPDGVVRYDPAGAFQVLDHDELGSDAFDYAVTDGERTSWATVTVTITGLNDAPRAVDDAITLTEGGTATIDAAAGVLANDSDPEGDALSAALLVRPAAGSATVAADGGFTYTHADRAVTTDTFSYTVSDGAASSTATVTVTITPVDDPPVAVADAVQTTEDDAVVVPVLANDTDPEGASLTVTAVGAATTGAATLDGADVRYDPSGAFEDLDDGESATDTFTYTVTDGATPATASVTVTVRGRNDAPTAAPDTLTLPEGGTVTVNAASGLLGNDVDVDGDTLAALLVTPPTHGTASVQASGAYTYTHDGSETTTDGLDYAVSDGTTTASSALAITVTPVDDPPVAVDDVVSTTEDAPITVTVLGNDTDAEGATLSVTAVTATGLLGTATRQGNQVRYDPNGRFEGLGVGEGALEVFTYRVTDGANAATGTVRVTVTGVNDAPIARPDAGVAAEGGATSGNALSNDSDPDGDALTAALGTAPAHGAATVGGTGAWTYTHDGSETTSDSFTYTVGDGRTTSTGTVTLTVTAVNDPPVLLLDGASGPVTTEFAAGGTAPVAASLALTDADDTVLHGATVALASAQGPQEVLGATVGGTALTAAWDAAAATLRITGNASVAHYAQVLRSVTFTTALTAPASPDRSATFTVTDGDADAVATATLRVLSGTCPSVKRSCRVWRDDCGAQASGVFSIDPDGSGPNGAFDVYCDMSRHGGGWALIGHIGEAGCADSDFTTDVGGAALATQPIPSGGDYRHLDIDVFASWGTEWTLRSAVDVYNDQSYFQYGFFRAEEGTDATLHDVGTDWGSGAVTDALEYLNTTTTHGLFNTTWLPVPGCTGGHCDAPVDLFTTRDDGSGGSCLTGGQTSHCHAIAAGISCHGGTMTAAFGMEDGVAHEWARKGTYWIRDRRDVGPAGPDTVLLLHFDGAIADSSPRSHPVTSFGGATTTADAKFGTGALSLDGVNDYVRITGNPSVADFDFGAGEWAVDFWAAWDDPGRAYQQLFNMGGDFHTEIEYGEPNGHLAVSVSANGSSWLNGGFGSTAAISPGTGTWRHVALQRKGNTIVLFFDGAPITSYTTSSALVGSPFVYLGYGFQSRYFDGRIDELKVTRTARFAPAGFAVPTAPYTE